MRRLHSHAPIILGAVLAITLCGCATVNLPQMVRRPWLRVDANSYGVPLTARVRVEVFGEREPLLGNGEFVDREIAEEVRRSLERRGYVIDDDKSDYTFRISYSTVRRDFASIETEMAVYSTMRVSNGSRGVAVAGPGVGLAAMVSTLFGSNSQSVALSQKAVPRHYYSHTAALSASSGGGDVVWQAESTWDSPSIDIMDDLSFFIQSSVSNLPIDSEKIIAVPRLANGRSADYFSVFCANTWFTCPGLPYRIVFSAPADPFTATVSRNWDALPAYVDLITHAEYALPTGVEFAQADVLSEQTWASVLLGGRYSLGEDGANANVMVRLEAQSYGYVIAECNIVGDETYNEFRANMDRWKTKVGAFWDFYAD